MSNEAIKYDRRHIYERLMRINIEDEKKNERMGKLKCFWLLLIFTSKNRQEKDVAHFGVIYPGQYPEVSKSLRKVTALQWFGWANLLRFFFW